MLCGGQRKTQNAQDDISAGERQTEEPLSVQNSCKSANETKGKRELRSVGDRAFSRVWSSWIEFVMRLPMSRSEKDKVSLVSLVHSVTLLDSGQMPFSPQPMRGNRAGSMCCVGAGRSVERERR